MTHSICGPVNIVGIQTRDESLCAIFELRASGIIDWICSDIIGTVELLEEVEKLGRNQVELSEGLIGRWLGIEVPVSNTVTNGEALEVIDGVIQPSSLIVPVVNLPSKVRTIDSGIRFT